MHEHEVRIFFEGPGTTHPAIGVPPHNTFLDYTHAKIANLTIIITLN